LKPWIRTGFYQGSGDKDATDKTHGTFFQVMPTPRPFAKFPFFDMMNNRDAMASLILRPHKLVNIASEFHHLSLSNSRDLWYAGGGVYQPWTFGYQGRAVTTTNSGLANLYDVSVDWKVKPAVTLSGYVGYANGADVIRSIYPKGKNGALSYLELNYRF